MESQDSKSQHFLPVTVELHKVSLCIPESGTGSSLLDTFCLSGEGLRHRSSSVFVRCISGLKKKPSCFHHCEILHRPS